MRAGTTGKIHNVRREAMQMIEGTLTLQDAIKRAAAFYARGQLGEAERLAQTILEVRADYFDALHLIAVIEARRRRYAEALASYDLALAVQPDYAEALNNRGITLQALKRFDEALVSCDRALAVRPDYAEALYNRGAILEELKRFDEALASYDRALAVRPEHADTLNNCGAILRELNRFDEALASYDRALAVRPDYAEAVYNRGNTLKALQRFDEALASYDKALVIKPDYAEALNNRANILRKLKRFDEALASYDKALFIKPDYAEALNNRANILRELKRFDEALASNDKALVIKPTLAEVLNNRGNILRELNRFGEALASYDKALVVKPGYAEALNNRGMVLKELGRLPEARQASEQAIQFAPRNATYYRALGDLRRYGAGDPLVAAMEELARDVSLSVEDRIELHFALAKAYEDLDRSADAFGQLLAGNALKRRQIAYDEAATLRHLKCIREVFKPEMIPALHDVGESSSAPVFIVGMPRSGSTLVEQILASHPQVFGAGELKYFGTAVANLCKTENGYPAFPEFVPSMPGEQFRQLGENYLADIKRLAPKAARITDKMPLNYIYVGLIHVALPNASIIHTIRDPVDTCISCFSKLFVEGNDPTYELAELGRYYRHYEALMEHWHRVLPPGRILDVRYEDVVANLESAARRIVAHCGLEWDGRCLAFHQTERPVRTASATQVRQPIYKSSVGRRSRYEPFLAPLLTELGRECTR
jgi:tetratricopeptide (TPR) repeat protein